MGVAKVVLGDVTKEFVTERQRVVAVEGISLSIRPQEFACLLGPSGCGKSTVLNLVAGFEQPTRGEVTVGGKPVAAKSKYDFPLESLKDQADVLRFAAKLEQGAVSAYLGAVPLFASRDLSKAAASILGDEAMHWAVLRNALGQNPVPSAFVA